jgi:hypothetical protein
MDKYLKRSAAQLLMYCKQIAPYLFIIISTRNFSNPLKFFFSFSDCQFYKSGKNFALLSKYDALPNNKMKNVFELAAYSIAPFIIFLMDLTFLNFQFAAFVELFSKGNFFSYVLF